VPAQATRLGQGLAWVWYINFSMAKKAFFILFFMLWILKVGDDYAYPEGFRVAILKSRNIEPYNTAMVSFEKALRARETGVEFFYYDLKVVQSQGTLDRLSSDIRILNPSLILALGTEATRFLKEHIDNIPVVFSMVLDPVGNGIVSDMVRPGGNFTGVTLDVPIDIQFNVVSSILHHVNKIGIVYDPNKTYRYIEEADIAAKKIGFELVKVPVSSEDDVPGAIETLKDKIDVLWAPVDNTVYTPQSAQYIILFTLRHRIPFVAFSDKLVKAGALIGLRGDYKAQGEKAAEIALKILKGASPGDIPVALAEDSAIFLNKKVGDIIGIKFSSDIVEKAAEIY